MQVFGYAIVIFLVSFYAVRADPLDQLDAAIAKGQLADARQIVEDAPDLPRYAPDYLLAYALLAEGRAADAAAIIRPWVERFPRQVRPRHLLINAQLAQQDYRAAVFNIRRNQRLVADPDLRRQYDDLLAQYEQVNPSTGLGLTFGASPSTNVNRGTGQSTVIINGLPFAIDASSRQRSGATVTFGLTGFRKFAVGERTDIVGAAALTLETGFSDAQQNVLSFAPSLQVQHSFERTLLSFGPVAEVQWLDGERYVDRVGLSFALSRQLSDKTSGTLQLRAVRQNYDTLDFLDGYKGSVGVSLRHGLAPDLTLTLGAEAERELTQASHLSYSQGKISAGLERTWDSGLYADFSISYARRHYSADFPAATFPRQDDRYEVQIGVAYQPFRIFGVTPYVGLRHIRNGSNISLYDYRSNDLVISARKRF